MESTKKQRREEYFNMMETFLDYVEYDSCEESWRVEFSEEYTEKELDELRGTIGHHTVDHTTHTIISLEELKELKYAKD